MLAKETYGLLEDLREHKQEECTKEVDGGNSDVETVGLLVHPGAENRDANEKGKLDKNESDSLDGSTALRETNKHGLDEDVSEPRNDEPVSSGLELYVEETPLVESNGIGVENVGRVLVHSDGALCKANNLGRGPSKDTNHGQHGQDRQDDETSRITTCELPEAEDHHLRKANEDYTEHDALKNSLPAIAEVEELVALHLASFDEAVADELEGKDASDSEKDEDDEESVSGEEDVGGLHLGPEADTLNATEHEAFTTSLGFGSSRVGTREEAASSTSGEL